MQYRGAARASDSGVGRGGAILSLLPHHQLFLTPHPSPLTPPSTYWAYDVRHVGDGGARGSPEVEHLGPWLDVNLVHAAQDCCCQLGAKGVPGTVLDFVISLLGQERWGRKSVPGSSVDHTALNPRALEGTGCPIAVQEIHVGTSQ